MRTLNELLDQGKSIRRRDVVSQMLGKLDQALLASWLEKVEMRDGRVTSTYYRDIADSISFNDFVTLYEALGYDFKLMDAWKDWRCGHGGCLREYGYSCDTNSCK